MANFFEELWTSVFTSGPTPTLMVATNASFAALQALLLALLVATYSIHFIVLSVLCGALWASINWFAKELVASKEFEEVKQREAEARAAAHDSDTETEDVPLARSKTSTVSKGKSSTLGVSSESLGLTKRRSLGESGTDSEWDKVDDVSAEE